MIRKLILAASLALVAAPALALHQFGLPALGDLPGIGGAKVVNVGSLVATGLI